MKKTIELTQEQIDAVKHWLNFGIGCLRQQAADTGCIVTEENLIDQVVVLFDVLDVIVKS